jgi:hypothetical protein
MIYKDVSIVRAHGDQRRFGDLEIWKTHSMADWRLGHIMGLESTGLVHCIGWLCPVSREVSSMRLATHL